MCGSPMQSVGDEERADVMTQFVEVLEEIVQDVLKQQTFRHVDVFSVPVDADDLPEVIASKHETRLLPIERQ